MALHRDIYWVGKQWAVTGHGIQACNQKQKSQFDVASSRLWEDGVQDSVRSLDWVNAEDFDKAVAAARKYYPEPPKPTISPTLPLTPPPAPPVSSPTQPTHMAAAPEPDPIRPVIAKFDMRFEGVRAKLRPIWRIRSRPEGRPNGK